MSNRSVYGTCYNPDHMSDEELSAFFRWVCGLRARSEVRGRFIRDTRVAIASNMTVREMANMLSHGSGEQQGQFTRLYKQYVESQ